MFGWLCAALCSSLFMGEGPVAASVHPDLTYDVPVMSLKRDEVVFDQTVNPLPDDGWLGFEAADQLQLIADDFQLQSETDITRVLVYGNYQQGRSITPEYAVLDIYSDAQGLPGSLLFSQMFSMPDNAFSGMFELAPTNLTLGAGR